MNNILGGIKIKKFKKKFFNSIKFKLTIVLLVIALVPMGVVSYFQIKNVESIIENSFIESTKREVSQVDKAINLYFDQLKANTRFLAENEYLKQVNDYNITQYLNNNDDNLMMSPSQNGGVEESIYYLFDDFSKSHPEVSYLYIGTKNGGMIQYPEGVVSGKYDPRDRPFYKKAIKNKGSVSLTEPYYWEPDDTINIGAVRTFANQNGEFMGVVGIDIGLNSLTSLIKDITIGEEGFIILADDQNNILAHPKNFALTFEKISELNVEKLNENLNQDSTSFEAVMEGEKYLFNTYKSEGTSWNFISVIPKSELEAQINQIYQQVITIIIILLILISILAIFISKKISDPIIEATNFSEEIAAGNLNAKKIEVKGNNEISSLSKSLNEMQEDLKDMISQINNIALNLSAASEELTASGEGLEDSAEKVGESIEHVASGAEEQSAQTEESTSVVAELSREIDNIDKMSKNMKKETKLVMENIESGSISMETSIKQIGSVNQNTTQVSESIGELGVLSEEIGNIVNLINGIASQTNLLALNAAIEAARAGEAGRGFSVVADEIRNLAEESSKATEKIEILIKDIQKGVNNSVSKMNETEGVVKNSVDIIEETKNSFDKVKELSSKLSGIIDNIDLKTDNVNTKGKEVAEIINQIAAVSEESAQRSEEVASYSQEQLNSTKEVVYSAKKLAETADRLTETVNKFNL